MSNKIVCYDPKLFLGAESPFYIGFAIFWASTILGGRGKKTSPVRHINGQDLQLKVGISSRVVRDNFSVCYGHSNITVCVQEEKIRVWDFKMGVNFRPFYI